MPLSSARRATNRRSAPEHFKPQPGAEDGAYRRWFQLKIIFLQTARFFQPHGLTSFARQKHFAPAS